MMPIYTKIWVHRKTSSLDGYIGLVILVCHVAGVSEIECVVESISEYFTKVAYVVLT